MYLSKHTWTIGMDDDKNIYILKCEFELIPNFTQLLRGLVYLLSQSR